MGHYPSLGADWRSDIRCKETGDPTDPHYREWTHKVGHQRGVWRGRVCRRQVAVLAGRDKRPL